MTSPETWDNGAADFAAAVLACRDEDNLALAVLGRYADRDDMLASAVKLFSEALDEQDIDAGHFRLWCQAAVRRR